MIEPLGGTEMTIDDRPTMTALQLAREAKESNGDCYYENRPVYVRTADGGLQRAVTFDWDGGLGGFVLASVEAPPQPVTPPEPPHGTTYVRGTQVWTRDDHLLDPAEPWWGTHHEDGKDWEFVAPIVAEPGWVRVVTDPADNAPALPWTTGEHKDRIAVTDNNLVWVNLTPDYHTPEEAEIRAAAILRAAREARQS